MTTGRLRAGELLAGAGAVVLLVALFLEWFAPGDRSGWDSLGWIVLALAVLAIALAAWLFVATAMGRPVSQVVAADVLAATAAPLALIALVLRVLLVQPGANATTTVEVGAWIGLGGAALLTLGAWWALADERTAAPGSAYVPPAPRPAPPAHSS